MTDSQQLLARYVCEHSDAAFRELVSRYVNLVYSTALRLVSNDSHLAQDVAQTVFTHLARTAHTLPAEVPLGGWLHRHTCFVAAKTMRTERRRRAREMEASAMHSPEDDSAASFAKIAPILDEAIDQLGDEDRAVITLRFLEQRDLRSVGEAVGATEEAARKRVSRALEKLQALLKRRGIALSVGALATTLQSSAVSAAPVGLAAGIASAAISGASTSTAAITLSQILPMTKLQTSLVGALLVAGVATTLVVEHNATKRQDQLSQSLKQKEAQLLELQDENQRLRAAQVTRSPLAAAGDSSELFRLRGEVARLRQDSRELARIKTAGAESQPLEGTLKLWAARVTQLQQSLEQMPEKKIPELQLLKDADWIDAVKGDRETSSEDGVRSALGGLRNAAKQKFGNILRNALKEYAAANNNQLPPSLAALKPYFQEPIDDSILQRYALTQSGDLANVPPKSFLVAEQAPPADDQHDMNYQFSMNAIRATSVGKDGGENGLVISGEEHGESSPNGQRGQQFEEIIERTSPPGAPGP
jgi:RNA polymerase sigma factor (sigma-70 family)